MHRLAIKLTGKNAEENANMSFVSLYDVGAVNAQAA